MFGIARILIERNNHVNKCIDGSLPRKHAGQLMLFLRVAANTTLDIIEIGWMKDILSISSPCMFELSNCAAALGCVCFPLLCVSHKHHEHERSLFSDIKRSSACGGHVFIPGHAHVCEAWEKSLLVYKPQKEMLIIVQHILSGRTDTTRN